MFTRRLLQVVSVLLTVGFLIGCAGPQAPAAVPAATQAPAVVPAATQGPTMAPAASKGPAELRIGVVMANTTDSQWDGAWVKALDRITAAKPHGLTITHQITDNTFGDDATVVIRNLAASGKFDIVWTTSTYSDQVEKVMDQFPNIMFVVQGSGNRGLGRNQYWTYMRVHEPAYLLGWLAGKMTKTNKVGAVGTYEADDVNDEINAFIQGAKDANPNAQATVTFIQSWYDPVKGAEATSAQAAAGIDYVLQLADGWEGCKASKIQCFGNFGDVNSLAPENNPNSTIALWDPTIKWGIDQWWAHVAEGKPFDGNKEPVWFSMQQGGSDIGLWHGFDAKVPKAVMDEFNTKRQEILDGKFKVPLNIETPKSGG